MPLMREWVEIHTDEDLLVHVVRELLSLAVDPNHVEVIYGTAGRVILAEIDLADAWYQMRLAKETENAEDDGTEVHASGFEVVASADIVEPSPRVQAAVVTVPTPAKRVAVRPSASLNGEDS